MRLVRQAALTIVAVAGIGAPAAAQEPQWLRHLEQHLEEQAEALGRIIEDQLARMQGRGPERNAQGGREVTEQFSRTVRLGPNGTLDLQNVAGDIIVTGTGSDEVRIEATRRVRAGSDAQARDMLRDLQIRVTERGGNIEVRTAYPRRRGGAAAVDYTVSVPTRANLVLRTVSGNVRVGTVRGELRAQSVSGDIGVTSVERVRSLNTVSGTLEVTDAEGSEIEGATVNGDVIARDLRVRTINFNSVSGDLTFTDVESERVKLTSVSGDVEYAGELMRSGRYEIQSHSGDVRVTPAGNTGFDVEANTFSGNVRSDYELAVRGDLSRGFAGPGRNRGLRGTFGGAGAALILQSFSGDVTILRR